MRIDLASAAPAESPRTAPSPAAPAPSDTLAAAGMSALTAAATAQPPKDPRTQAKDSQDLQDAVRTANEAVRKMSTNIKFETDHSSGQVVVQVIDAETQKVLRQMPSEEMLSLSKAIDRMRGLMIHLKV